MAATAVVARFKKKFSKRSSEFDRRKYSGGCEGILASRWFSSVSKSESDSCDIQHGGVNVCMVE